MLILQTELAPRFALSFDDPAPLRLFPPSIASGGRQLGDLPLFVIERLACTAAEFLQWFGDEQNAYLRRHVHRVFEISEEVSGSLVYVGACASESRAIALVPVFSLHRLGHADAGLP